MINPVIKKQKQIINFFIDNENYLIRKKYKDFLMHILYRTRKPWFHQKNV